MPSDTAWRKLGRVAGWIGRLAALAAVLGVGLWTIGVWRGLIAPAPIDRPDAPGAVGPAGSTDPQVSTDPQNWLAGSWSFAEGGDTARLETLAAAQLDARWDEPPDDGVVSANRAGAWALGIEPADLDSPFEPCGVFRRRSYDAPGLRTAIFSLPEPEGERVVACRFAIARDDDTWLMIERAASGPAAQRAVGRLLCLPSSAAALATRRDQQGRLVAELVAFDPGGEPLVEFWTSQGWQVDALDEASQWWLCRRRDEAVLALRLATDQAPQGLLLLVAAP